MSKSKRKSRLINCKVQRALLFQFVCHWIYFFLAIVGVSFVMHAMFQPPSESYAAIFAEIKNDYMLMVYMMFALVPIFLRDLIKLSHRFVGPMVRLRKCLDKAARGEHVEPLKFRDGDFWNEMADSFNKLMERIPQAESAVAAATKSESTPDDYEPETSQTEGELVATP